MHVYFAVIDVLVSIVFLSLFFTSEVLPPQHLPLGAGRAGGETWVFSRTRKLNTNMKVFGYENASI
jgi:hypothetical protein